MKVSYLLLISLLVVGALLVPAVSAEVILDTHLEEWQDTSASWSYTGSGTTYPDPGDNKYLYVEDITLIPHLNYVVVSVPGNKGSLADGTYPLTYTLGGQTRDGVLYVEKTKNVLGVVTNTRFTMFFYDWDIGALQGKQVITLNRTLWSSPQPVRKDGPQPAGDALIALTVKDYTNNLYYGGESYSLTHSSGIEWENQLKIIKNPTDYIVDLTRSISGEPRASRLIVTDFVGNSIYDGFGPNDLYLRFISSQVANVTVVTPSTKSFIFTGIFDSPGETPTDPTDPTVLRTGIVTMTDHNGTTISGFEVSAINAYTGQSYNVSTDTDIAVMSLPMDRTTTIRNPQTGEYETVPVGYYKFYGHTPGYKMVNEDGIQVAVMPQEYGSYQLCDIVVTPETGYLTGQHMLQIRSRSDNSVLQTGTISAKSATTGEWYNTTVTGGIATLVLPYDTSNSISQYAGNYYVYATSPGYEDSEYGTQIVVMPHTVSEINVVHLTPIGGVPTAGNVTLRIQAFSEYGPGVANASIFIAGVVGAGSSVWDTYTASSTGYLAVSVPGNSTYDIVASAEGYYDSARRIDVFTEDPGLIEIKLYLSGAPTVEPTTQPTGWPTTQPTTTPTGGIPDDDDGSESFLMQAVRGIGLAFGVGFSTAKLIFGMLLALSIGYATAKHLRGGAAEFGLGLLGGTMLGVLIGLLPVWIVVVLLLIVGLYIGNRYIGGSNNG